MQITKIKTSDGKIEIHFDVTKEATDEDGVILSQTDEFTMKSGENPAPEFSEALQALATDVCRILELPEKYEENMAITGVSFSHKEDYFGVVITAQKMLDTSNAPFNINTPFKQSEVVDAYLDGDMPLSTGTVEKLEQLQIEAVNYVNGRRAQMSLFSEQKEVA